MPDDLDAYVEATGHEPPAPDPDHPLAWQWDYKGTKADRERLEQWLEAGGDAPPGEDEPPPSQDETLW